VPFQQLLALVAFVAAAGAVALRLGELLHVDEAGHVLFAALGDGLLVGLVQGGVVPAFHAVDADAVGVALFFEALQQLADAALGGLVFLAHADAPAVVPHA